MTKKAIQLNWRHLLALNLKMVKIMSFNKEQEWLFSKVKKKNNRQLLKFLKWFTSDKQNIAFSNASGYLPVTKSANDLDKITDEVRLLGRENISTDEQLFSYKESLKGSELKL